MTAFAAADLVILSAATESNELEDIFDHAQSIIIYGPTTLAETVTVQVSHDGTTYADLQDEPSGTDITIPAATAVKIASVGGIKGLRLQAGVGVAADRTFKVRINEEIGQTVYAAP